jgi:hypothetical protein
VTSARRAYDGRHDARVDRLRGADPGARRIAGGAASTLESDAMRLRIPAVLAFTVLGTAAAVTASSCGDDGKPTADAGSSCRPCIYEGSDNGNCPFLTCATGSDQDQCPTGCIPEPVV